MQKLSKIPKVALFSTFLHISVILANLMVLSRLEMAKITCKKQYKPQKCAKKVEKGAIFGSFWQFLQIFVAHVANFMNYIKQKDTFCM